MPEPDHVIRQGDAGQSITDTLLDANNDPVNLAGAAVRFRMAEIGAASVTLDEEATIVQAGDGADGSLGKVSYAWAEGDTDEPGLYLADWQITFDGGSVQTFPNGSYLLVEITDEVPTGAEPVFASSQDLVDRLGVEFSADEHLRAGRLLERASNLVRAGARQHISLIEDEELALSGSWPSLRLPERPVVSVASVVVDGETLDAADWYVSGDELVRGSLSSQSSFGWWGTRSQSILITYTHGFAVTPEIARTVCLEAAVRVWTNPANATQYGFGVEQVSHRPANGLMLTDEETRALREGLGSAVGTVQLH